MHYHTGTMTRNSPSLEHKGPEGYVEIHPEDAKALSIAGGEWVRISSRRGEVVTRALLTDRVARGVVFMSFHFAEANANRLTNAALDPVAKIPEYKVCAVKVEKLKE
jgi:predicted molibdopterin-dependent oxidoreductase YjgC